MIYVNNQSIFFQECSKYCSVSALHNLPYIILLFGKVYDKRITMGSVYL